MAVSRDGLIGSFMDWPHATTSTPLPVQTLFLVRCNPTRFWEVESSFANLVRNILESCGAPVRGSGTQSGWCVWRASDAGKKARERWGEERGGIASFEWETRQARRKGTKKTLTREPRSHRLSPLAFCLLSRVRIKAWRKGIILCIPFKVDVPNSNTTIGNMDT